MARIFFFIFLREKHDFLSLFRLNNIVQRASMTSQIASLSSRLSIMFIRSGDRFRQSAIPQRPPPPRHPARTGSQPASMHVLYTRQQTIELEFEKPRGYADLGQDSAFDKILPDDEFYGGPSVRVGSYRVFTLIQDSRLGCLSLCLGQGN